MQNLTDKNLSLNIIKSISIFSLIALLTAFTAPEYRLIQTVPVNALFFTTDNLRNAYVINEKNELLKFTPEGQQTYQYSQKKYGKLSAVDATNPLKLILLYPEFSTIITLSNTLSETGVYDLQQIGIREVPAFSLSFDNHIWIFDEESYRLKKVDENLQVLRESEDLRTVISEELHPNFLLEKENWLYLNDPEQGIYVFDIYASYFKKIPIKGLKDFQVINKQLYFYQDGELNSYDLQTFEEKKIALPEPDGGAANETPETVKVRIERNRLYLLQKNQLLLYDY